MACNGLPHLMACNGLPHLMACNGLPHLMACNGLPHLMACNGLPHQVSVQEEHAHKLSLLERTAAAHEKRARQLDVVVRKRVLSSRRL
jgi:hypothetical protein